MSDAEGWGTPDWLPPGAARSVALAELAAEREDRAAAAEREQRAEDLSTRALAAYREQAERRGEVVGVLELARGAVHGRDLAGVFGDAEALAARADARSAAEARRWGSGDPVQLTHVEFAEPQIQAPAARSETKWRIGQVYRHFADRQEARRRLAEAERAADAARDDYGYVGEAPKREARTPGAGWLL